MNQSLRKQRQSKFCGYGMVLGVLLFVPMIVCAQAVVIDENTRQRARVYEPLFFTTAQQYRIDPRLLWVIAYLESRFRPQVVSPKGARGLMQLMPATATRWGVQNPYEPEQAIPGAARYVQYLEQRFAGRVDLTLAAYNAGETAVTAYQTGRRVRVGHKLINPFAIQTNGVPPYRETRTYVRTGLTLLRQFSVVNPSSPVIPRVKAQTVASIASEVVIPTPTIRKSISYVAAEISSDPSPPTPTTPRSIIYQSR